MKRIVLALVALAALYIWFSFWPPHWYASTEPVLRAAFTSLQEVDKQDVLTAFMAPGLYLCGLVGFHPSSGYTLLMVLLFSWWVWATAIRLAYLIPARQFGFYDPGQFQSWLWLWFPWRPLYLYDTGNRAYGLARFLGWLRQLRFGGGANNVWTGFLETATYVFNPNKDCILVGRLWFHRLGLFQPIAVPAGGRHVAMIAATGAGKTVQLMTMLGTLDTNDSCFVVDCDGAMVGALGASLEATGHKVVKLDPDNIARGFKTAGRWNPMDELACADKRYGRAAVYSFATRLANALIVEDSKTQPYFANTARGFMLGLILYVWLVENSDKTLRRVRQLLCSGLPEKIEDPEKETPFGRLVFEMQTLALTGRDDGCNGQIFEAIGNTAGMIENAQGSGGNNVKSTAESQTMWLDDPNVREIMGASTINCEDLKFTNACVFIVATLSDIQTRLGPYMRAFTVMTMYAFERAEKLPDKLKKPCLFVLDEMPNYGRIDTLATAAPGFRKYGVRLIAVTQSIEQLRTTYPNEWRRFLGSAQVRIWMGLDDDETLEFLSEKQLGKHLRNEQVDGGWLSDDKPRRQLADRQLMDPQQCREFLDPTTGQIIVTRFGRSPMRLKQLAYFKELPVWKYAASPAHGEKPARAFTRRAAVWVAAGYASFEQFAENFESKIGDDLGILFPRLCWFAATVYFCIVASMGKWPELEQNAPEVPLPLILRIVIGCVLVPFCFFFFARRNFNVAYPLAAAIRDRRKATFPFHATTIKAFGIVTGVALLFLLPLPVPFGFIRSVLSLVSLNPLFTLIGLIAFRWSRREGVNIPFGPLACLAYCWYALWAMLGLEFGYMFVAAGLILHGISAALLWPVARVRKQLRPQTRTERRACEVFEREFHPEYGRYDGAPSFWDASEQFKFYWKYCGAFHWGLTAEGFFQKLKNSQMAFSVGVEIHRHFEAAIAADILFGDPEEFKEVLNRHFQPGGSELKARFHNAARVELDREDYEHEKIWNILDGKFTRIERADIVRELAVERGATATV